MTPHTGLHKNRRWLSEGRRTKIEQAYARNCDLNYVMSSTGEDHETVARVVADMNRLHGNKTDVASAIDITKPAVFDATVCSEHDDFILGYTSVKGVVWTYCKRAGWHQ